MLIALLFALNKGLYTVRNIMPFEWASGCTYESPTDEHVSAMVEGEFDLRDGCNPVGNKNLKSRTKYLATIYAPKSPDKNESQDGTKKIEVENPFGWKDWTIPASPEGIDRDSQDWAMTAFRPLLRKSTADYFTPVLRIGRWFPEEVILSRDKIDLERSSAESVAFKFESQEGGRPYFYVNDVPSGFWRVDCRKGWDWFPYKNYDPYCNNKGAGKITIEPYVE